MPLVANRVIESRVRIKPIAKAGEPKLVLRRAQMLDRKDRLLVELVMKGRATRKELSDVFGIQPGTVTRRVQRLSARLFDPLVADLLDDSCPLAPEYRQVGIEYFLLRLGAAPIADKHRIPVREVERRLAFVRGWHRGLRVQRDWGKVVGYGRTPRGGRRKPHISVLC